MRASTVLVSSSGVGVAVMRHASPPRRRGEKTDRRLRRPARDQTKPHCKKHEGHRLPKIKTCPPMQVRHVAKAHLWSGLQQAGRQRLRQRGETTASDRNSPIRVAGKFASTRASLARTRIRGSVQAPTLPPRSNHAPIRAWATLYRRRRRRFFGRATRSRPSPMISATNSLGRTRLSK